MDVQKEQVTFDIVIVGAGLSGIGAAYWIQKKCPDKQFTILEARNSLGGTWDLFRYPGVRSDSDMFTFGYRFKPWQNPQSMSDGESILEYLNETVRENGIDKRIQYGHEVLAANWSAGDKCWTIRVRCENGEKEIHSRFLYLCSGYYDYSKPYRPEFTGEDQFRGKIVLPQFWPEDLDYSGKKVLIVGSGATAITLVPAMVADAAHVTMLQRSPTYVLTLPNRNELYVKLKKWISEKVAYKITRWVNLGITMALFAVSKVFPKWSKKMIMKGAASQLPPGFEVEKHFNPPYNPWEQRLCVVPDGDLFQAIKSQKASVVTDEITHFTEKGIALKSGRELEADIVVLATGLNMKLLGGARISVDNKAIDTSEIMIYKGMMVSDVPNLILAFGYTNNAWTLKVDLTSNYLCKLLRYMDKNKLDVVVPQKRGEVSPEPFLNLNSGYVTRSNHILPRQGAKKPWRVYQNYLVDMLTIRFGRIADGVLKFNS